MRKRGLLALAVASVLFLGAQNDFVTGVVLLALGAFIEASY